MTIENINIIPEKKQEEAERLYDKVDEKIKVILELRNFADSKSGDSVEDLEVATEKKFEEVKSYCSKGTMEKLRKVEETQEQLADLEKKIDALENELGDEMYENEEWIELSQEAEDLRNLIDEIENDDEVSFLYKVEDFLNGLVEKREQVLNCQKHFKDKPEQMLKKIYKEAKTVPKEVRYDGYNIDIFLEKADYEKLVGNSDGLHWPNTPVNIIKINKTSESSIKHEHNHNLSESFSEDVYYSRKLLGEIKKCIIRIDRADILKFFGKSDLQKELRNYTYANFSEIIADIDLMESGEINTFYTNFLNAVHKLNALNSQIKNKETKKLMESEIENMKEMYTEFIAKLSSLFLAAKKTGMTEELKAGIILFGSKKINKIERQMQHNNSSFELYERLQPLINGNLFKKMELNVEEKLLRSIFDRERKLVQELVEKKTGPASFFELNNLEKLLDLLEKTKEVDLTLEEKNACVNNIGNYLYGGNDKTLDELVSDRNKFYHFKSLVEKISEFLAMEEIAKMPEEIIDGFLRRKYDEAIDENDFSKLEIIYREWPYGKDSFDYFLENLRDNPEKVLDDYNLTSDQGLDHDDIRQTSFWKFLERIGMAN